MLVVGKDKLTRNFFAENRTAQGVVMRAELMLRLHQDKLRSDEAKLSDHFKDDE